MLWSILKRISDAYKNQLIRHLRACLAGYLRSHVDTGRRMVLSKDGAVFTLGRAQRNNNVYCWTPVSPARLCHYLYNDNVPCANATAALSYFTVVDADVKLKMLHFGSHIGCATYCLIRNPVHDL